MTSTFRNEVTIKPSTYTGPRKIKEWRTIKNF